MQEYMDRDDLSARLSLIENMIAEGRQTTENWSWMFVLWGMVYYVALAWSAWGRAVWAWPVTVSLGVILSIALGFSKRSRHMETMMSRAVGAIWIAFGVSVFLLFSALGLSGRLVDQHVFVAVLCATLGTVNGASGLILRWRIQLACAMVWCAAAVIACFGSDTGCTVVFIIAVFLCQIVFGMLGLAGGAHKRKRRGPVHA